MRTFSPSRVSYPFIVAALTVLGIVRSTAADPPPGVYGAGRWIECHNTRVWIPCQECATPSSSSTGEVIVCPSVPGYPLATVTIDGGSRVDVPGCEYHHDADDYVAPSATAEGCQPCGGGGADQEGRMPSLWLKRHHRTRHFLPGAAGERPASFGPGVYSNFDRSLELTTNPGGSTYIHLYDPLQREAIETRDRNDGNVYDAVVDGIYHEQAHHVVREIRTLGASGALVTDQAQVVTAVLLHHNGTREFYETVRTGVVNNTGGIFTTWARLTRIEDRNGNAITISYRFPRTATDTELGGSRTKLWQMSQVRDAYGRTMSFAYRATPVKGTWAVERITLPTTQQIAYQYDDIVGLKRVEHPGGSVSTFAKAYDSALDQMVFSFDDPLASGRARRTTVRVSPDTEQWKGLVHSVKGGDGQYLYFGEDLAIDPKTIDPALSTSNSKVQHVYVGDNTLYRLVTLIFDQPQRIEVATDFVLGGPTTGLHYEPVGTYASGGGFITRHTRVPVPGDASRDLATGYAYQAGRPGVTVRTDPDLRSETTSYTGLMQPLEQVDRLGRRTVWEYSTDGRSNLLARTDAAGTPAAATWRWTYNARGQVLEARDPLYVASAPDLHTTSYVYDAAGHLAQVVDAADVAGGVRPVRHFTHDPATGRLLEATDPDGRRVRYSYDARNRVTRIEYGVNLASGDEERFVYDVHPVTGAPDAAYAGLLTRHIDRNGNLTRHDYDAQGRRTVTTVLGLVGGPDAATVYGTTSVTYRPGTRLEATRLSDGDLVTWTYGARQRLVATARRTTASRTLTESLAYDGADRVTSRTDAYGRRTFLVYDAKNDWVVRTVRELVPGGIAAGTDLAALVRSTALNPDYVIEDRTYDHAGQVLTVVDGRGITSRFEYDAQGRQTARVQASATPAGMAALSYRSEFRYDVAGNRTHVVHPRTGQPGETGSFITRSTYGGRNLRLSETEADGRSGEAATRRWTYTRTGRVLEAIDFRGKITRHAYLPCCDRLESVTAPGGFVTRYGYDRQGNVIAVTDPNGNLTATAYDPRRRVTRTTNGEGETTTWTYDENATDASGLSATYAAQVAGLGLGTNANGQVVAVRNHLGETRVEIRDGLGRPLRRLDGNGDATTFAYDTITGDLVESRVTDALGHASRSRSDGAGLVRERYDAQGRKTAQAFDANGNRRSLRDPNLVGLDCTYDAADREIRCQDTASPPAVTTRAYNAHGSVVSETDALLKATTHDYDGRERRIRTVDRLASAGETRFAYDANRNLTRITDAESRVTDYAYTDRDLLASEVLPVGQQTPADGSGASTDRRSYTYDAGGRLATRTDQDGVVTTYAYDRANRLVARRYPDGLDDGFAYDDAGRLTQATSARFATRVTRDYTAGGERAGRLRAETQTVGGRVSTVGYAYDADGQVTTLTHPDGRTVTRSYTSRHQLESVGFDGAVVATRAYDLGGRLVTTTLGNGLVETRTWKPDDTVATIAVPGVTAFSYTYDADKRKTYEGHQSTSDWQEFTYDGEGRLTGWRRDGAETQAWTLSKVGDWSATTRNGATQTRTHSPVHETLTLTSSATTTPLGYDRRGNLAIDQAGQRLDWDAENRLARSRADAASSGYRYDALGRRLGKVALGVATTYVHDGAQVIAEYEAPALQSGAIGAPALAGGFSDNGQGTVTLSAGGTDIWGASDQFRFAYAQLAGDGSITARVTSQSNTHASAKAGVMVRESLAANARHVSLLAMPGGSLAFERRATVGGATVNAGVPGVSVPTWLRLTRSGGLITAERSVDGIAWIASGSDATVIPAGTTAYIGLAVTSHDAAATSTAVFTNVLAAGDVRTTTAPSLARTYVYGSHVDEPLALITPSARSYYHANHLHSVAALTSGTGAVVERYRYDAYGQRTVLAPDGTTVRAASTQGNQVGFTGRYLDRESGLWYFRARYYSGMLGRFIGRDPSGYVDGASLYRAFFVPIGVDPLGLHAQTGTYESKYRWEAYEYNGGPWYWTNWSWNDVGYSKASTVYEVSDTEATHIETHDASSQQVTHKERWDLAWTRFNKRAEGIATEAKCPCYLKSGKESEAMNWKGFYVRYLHVLAEDDNIVIDKISVGSEASIGGHEGAPGAKVTFGLDFKFVPPAVSSRINDVLKFCPNGKGGIIITQVSHDESLMGSYNGADKRHRAKP